MSSITKLDKHNDANADKTTSNLIIFASKDANAKLLRSTEIDGIKIELVGKYWNIQKSVSFSLHQYLTGGIYS